MTKSNINYINEEQHLVKTYKEDGSFLGLDRLISVSTKRQSDGGKSLENLFIIIKWEQHPNERCLFFYFYIFIYAIKKKFF